MATSQVEIESQTIELSGESFDTFCEDISGMLGVDIECEQQQTCTETIEALKKRFKKLVAVNIVKADGALDGTFQIIFDQEGLFTLAGIIVMMPEKKILENRKKGSESDARDMGDAMGEAGNLLVGAWDRVFRDELEGHGHFVQTNTFIGKPWDKPAETVGLSSDEEFVFVPYEMTIDPYPAFHCGVVFPKTILGASSESNAESVTPAEEKTEEETKENTEEKPKTDAVKEPEPVAKEPEAEKTVEKVKESVAEEKIEATAEPEQQEETEKKAQDNQSTSAEETEPPDQEPATDKAVEKEESVGEEDSEANVEVKSDAAAAGDPGDETELKAETTDDAQAAKEPPAGEVSETIQKMTESAAVFTGESSALAMCAKDIMQKEVIWGVGDDSVEQTLAKMQQADSGYMMVGADGALEGIVSKSDITGAISPYLRPVFAKWHRPMDDATLQIKIKWVMSSPVHTVKPETPLSAIIENMCQFGGRALPVVDQQGKVQGLVTVFDILQALPNGTTDVSTVGKTVQSPPLV